MEIVRCLNCNKKLAEAEFIRLSIKCSRCGAMNQLKATEPLNQEACNGKTNNSLGRRQTPPG
ncbi:Com family DNA-binding transcriptional regulator [Methylicorpusculum sp.]|uniref:Com family DNA-binding transcriptional regulator n=1 Tax=Methylicorpusculum sp. TaxID=2713644 RepID=UPI00351F22FA